VKLLNGGTHNDALPFDRSISDKERDFNNNEFSGTVPAASSTDKKDLSKKAKKLFDILAERFSRNESIKAKLLELTGKASFFELSDEEAEAAINEIVGNKSNNGDSMEKAGNSDLPEEVKEFKSILTSMYGKNGSNAVNEKLKELTGHDSFEKLSKGKANEAIETLTAASISEF
jgi:uncharacterized protein YaaW (UPF0174 family)